VPGEPAPKRPRGRPRLTSPSPEYIARLEQIIDAAAGVFGEKGYDASSLEDVAEALDLRKASLYHYVNSKGQLLYCIFDRYLAVSIARIKELSASIDDPVERLVALISHQVSVVSEEKQVLSVFFSARPRLDPEYEKRIRELEREYLQLYIDAVRAAMDAGAIPKGNPRYAAHAVLGMSSWVQKWFDPDGDDWVDVVRYFVRLVLREEAPTALPSSQDILKLIKPTD
jgi:AcrR family transcriptional regulator